MTQFDALAQQSPQSVRLSRLSERIGNSPRATMQRRVVTGIQEGAEEAHFKSAKPVQRLIAIGDPISDDVGRFVAVHNIQKRFPGEQIVHISNANLGNMKNGEVLYISAHGSPDSVGSLGAKDFAALLIRQGIKTGAKIDLKACNTAIPGKSFVERLEAEISGQSNGAITVLIEGYTGTHVIKEDGSSGAKDPDLNKGVNAQEYRGIIAKYAQNINDAKEYIRRQLGLKTPLEEIATAVAGMTSELFKELYTHNEKVLKPEHEARGTSSEDHLRVNLDEYIGANLRSTDPMWGDDLVLKLVRERERQKWSKQAASYIA